MLTDRLELIPATVELCDAETAGRGALSRVLGVTVPDDWPPPVFEADDVERVREQLRSDPASAEWTLHYLLERANSRGPARTLVGIAGYAGPPTVDGSLEIGYAIVAAYQRKGYATEAVAALLTRAFADQRVHRVVATTYETLQPSIRVLEKAGFVAVAAADARGLLRFERSRPDTLQDMLPNEP